MRPRSYSDKLIKAIVSHYLKHGVKKTCEKYSKISPGAVRGLIERNTPRAYKPNRAHKWTEEEKIQLVKFAGLISIENQLKFFKLENRTPNTIQARREYKTEHLHGLPYHLAVKILNKGFPFIRTQMAVNPEKGYIRLVLWCDAVFYLRADCPNVVKDIVLACAKFQFKLFGGNPRQEILKMLEEMK